MLIAIGLYKKETILCFSKTEASSRLDKLGKCKVKMINIDTVCECNDAAFIKMDIEGVKMDAFYGAREIIKKNHPKLNINCILDIIQKMR